MIYAVIDLGSNTIRMNVYRLRNGKFRLLFSKKATAGIVSYVKDGRLNREGICEICSTLESFKKVLEHLQIEQCSVFATASLRNIDNTEEVITQVKKKTGMKICLISGEEEGRLSFRGAAIQLSAEDGLFIDIGGGSTELVRFAEGKAQSSCSLPIGSLNLYNRFVHDIIPTAQERKEISLYVEGARSSLKESCWRQPEERRAPWKSCFCAAARWSGKERQSAFPSSNSSSSSCCQAAMPPT